MMGNLSIRLRLTTWYGGVLAIVLIVFGAVIYVTMRHQMLSRLDHGLREEMADVLSEIQRAKDRDSMLEWLDRRFGQHQGFDFQITTTDGGRVFVNDRLGDVHLPIPSPLMVDRDVFATHQRTAVPRRRIVTRKLQGPEQTLIVQVARSLDFYDHEMSQLFLTLLLTGPLTLLIAIGGGYFLAWRALWPVERMTETANRIEVTQLSQRIDIANANDELGRLATTLNGMLDRLEKSFREMQRFAADASHELRTPISVIRTEAEVALNKPISDDEKQNLLSNILEECERLTSLTDQLLTLSREEAGITPLRRDALDVGDLASHVAETLRPLADAKRLGLAVARSGTTMVVGDADRLKQVAYNLLENAIKYTPPAGRVEVTVARAGGVVDLVVRDTGVGIDSQHLPHVFERFYRVDEARTRAEGGTGLGLSIVRSIVVAHGGHVAIESQPNEGTQITVSLPSTPQTHDVQ